MNAVRIFVLCLCAAMSATANQVQWTFDAPLGNVDSSPSVVDINADGRDEVIATTVGGCVIALDSAGSLLWQTNLRVPFSISPTTLDLVEGPEPEVLVLNQTGTLYCLSSIDGAQIWSYDLPADIEWGTTAIAVADVNQDGALDIVTGTRQGHVVCLSAEGVEQWTYKGEHGFTLCPAIGPVGNASEPSIIISGTTIPVLCLDGHGKEVWRLDAAGRGASPIIADINQDGANEILTGWDNALIAVDATGKLLWQYDLPKEIDSSICVGDADEDGLLEIYVIDLSGRLAAVAPDGTELWQANVLQRVRRSPAIVDIDGDDSLEVVVGGYSGRLHLFTPKGELKEELTMRSTTNGSPTVTDFDGDGTPYLVYVMCSGETAAYKWPNAKPGAKCVWAEYRFDAARTATYRSAADQSKVRIRSADFGALYAGPNSFSVEIENPDGAPLRIEMSVEKSGQEARVLISESSEKSFAVESPYTLPTKQPTEIVLQCRVHEGTIVAARRAQKVYVVPFIKELAAFHNLLNEAESLARRLPQPYAFLGRLAALRDLLPGYEARAAVAGTLSDVEARELRDALRSGLEEIERTRVLLEHACEAHTEGKWPLRLVRANPWAPFGGFDELIEGRLNDGALRIEAFRGETEHAALNVFNLDMPHLEARVEIDPLVPREAQRESRPARGVIKLHEVVSVATQTLDMSADVLPVMNSGYVVQLPGWHARQLWFALDSSALAPGAWGTTVHVRTLEVESRSFAVPLDITVWATAAPDRPALRHCNWGYVY
ncbi:MAG TPA: hypothetical protein ENN80_06690, partial [Candidatus Hydrogenedentes bacterium]|nr:hypothetical protein [Candidatus Hydrogenedentota bacterium]